MTPELAENMTKEQEDEQFIRDFQAWLCDDTRINYCMGPSQRAAAQFGREWERRRHEAIRDAEILDSVLDKLIGGG